MKIKPLHVILFVLFGVILTCVLTSCSPQKRAQRKQDKLVDKASSSRAVLQRLYPFIQGIWPCANDTTVIKSTDTLRLVNIKRVTDTLRRHDTLYIFHTDTAEFERTKTIYRTIVDHKRENDLKDSLHAAEREKSRLNGIITEKNEAIGTAKKDARHWLTWLFICGAVLVGSNILWLKRAAIFPKISKLFKK